MHITAGDAVVADAERLYQRQLACGQTFAGEDTLNRHRDVLLEGAVALDAHRLVVRTAVYETATAGVALAAVEVGVAGDDITGLEALVIFGDIHDAGAELMARHTGVGGERLVSGVACQVSAADTAIHNLQQGLTYLGGGNLCVLAYTNLERLFNQYLFHMD